MQVQDQHAIKNKKTIKATAGAVAFSLTFFELYSMKIKEQTRKLAAGCSKHSFEVADKTDVV
ncbi:hypothetical protein [Streptococcus pneumoniae]|uniref:hypothetical protein n=1 Tax=Streptococcus pneumoniae TaxID=1313 RepID=UPI0002312689|nr:hypothetical protein [Streptococcus pneumoniae]EHE32436.1 tRNA (Guanine-N(1)-)-methyltransferase domain protein [Streptococcus pneumoniae GA47283]UKP37339.1 hypothetical protein EQH34_00975 [Streptococcus pneumoniae]UKP39264.1 hypothetical protein EQH33_00975 [Streptococcus pneumoniae]BDS87605.1 hypothetical protein PC1520_01740 [Streptococcus pneumoniae]BEL28244.1 hypothetical protein TKY120829_01640 [Streptococcus pneumoniae]